VSTTSTATTTTTTTAPAAADTSSPALAAAEARWSDAVLAAMLFTVDPHGLGGVRVMAGAGPVREAWLQVLRSAWPPQAPWRKLPAQAGDDRLLGGLDLTATLQSGRPVAQRGLLAEADAGLVLVPMAERLPPTTAAHLCAVIDRGEVVVAREGVSAVEPARCGVVALDEAAADDDPMPAALVERLGLQIDLQGLSMADVGGFALVDGASIAEGSDTLERAEIAAVRLRLPTVQMADPALEALVGAASAFGVVSLRAAWLAVRAARAHAAWRGHEQVEAEDLSVAVRLVLMPRATRLPQPADDPVDELADESAEPPAPPEHADTADDRVLPPPASDSATDSPPPDPAPPPADDAAAPTAQQLQEQVLQAAVAAMPPGLLARLAVSQAAGAGGRGAGRAGPSRLGQRRGRPAGVRRALPVRGARLSLIDTLRAAAPWQGLRQGSSGFTAAAHRAAPAGTARSRARSRSAPSTSSPSGSHVRRVQVRPEDFHIRRYQQRSETTTVFVVDASGSAALHRLAEAKGAVELLLADCYVRRDSVALVAFRGAGAELLLPPTRSLVRAKRSLASLPGGGSTPLAAGLDTALAVADAVRRRGDLPMAVVLTDGRANRARNGEPGREQAELDARQSARLWRAAGIAALVVDTSAKPHPAARELAREMGAAYLPLPHADAAGLSSVVAGAVAGTLASRGAWSR
jgi:magnesium chelatase subunit D